MSTDSPPLMIVAPGPDPISCKLVSIETPPTYVPGPILIVSPLFAAATAGAIWVYGQPYLHTLSVVADAGAMSVNVRPRAVAQKIMSKGESLFPLQMLCGSRLQPKLRVMLRIPPRYCAC